MIWKCIWVCLNLIGLSFFFIVLSCWGYCGLNWGGCWVCCRDLIGLSWEGFGRLRFKGYCVCVWSCVLSLVMYDSRVCRLGFWCLFVMVLNVFFVLFWWLIYGLLFVVFCYVLVVFEWFIMMFWKGVIVIVFWWLCWFGWSCVLLCCKILCLLGLSLDWCCNWFFFSDVWCLLMLIFLVLNWWLFLSIILFFCFVIEVCVVWVMLVCVVYSGFWIGCLMLSVDCVFCLVSIWVFVCCFFWDLLVFLIGFVLCCWWFGILIWLCCVEIVW